MSGGARDNGTLVLYPSPGMGHLVSMVQLGKLIVSQGFSVTILIVKAHYNTGSTDSFIARVSSANPSISFHTLQPPASLPHNPSPHHEAHAFDILRLNNPNLRAFLLSSPPRALIFDFFCIHAVDVAKELAIPCYCFFTSSANGLACLLHIPRGQKHTRVFFMLGSISPDCDGIMVNTVEALEPRALEAITAGRCTLEGVPTPPIYCIGPLITEGRENIGQVDCIAWLGTQPKGSVVFLCFRKSWVVLRRAAQRDSRWAGEERAEVPVGGAKPAG
ncbi:hypothetical protein J5N97_004656 [Dioscorea zingiberensis]|uniref:Uncharacterized protein n=1 Tax=Dioscorea zingiberensis TaxID=325984 RepID=A0A9D5D6J9_9LILI|nr:hypothetical protein J5N97_004656 [Dioscorea zingiberensis]